MTGKYSWKFQSILQEVLLEQDNCIVCGCKKNLGVHHIIHTTSDEEGYADKNNIVVMCRTCHTNYHNQYPNKCDIITLINFIKEYERKEVEDLRAEITELKIERRDYQDLINYLLQIQ